MYGFIKGTYHSESETVLTSGGMGIAVKHCGDPLTEGQEVEVFAYTSVSENDISVWTFDAAEDKTIFLALINAPGIGPTMGGALIRALGAAGVYAAISEGDVEALVDVPGVGKATAKKIIANVKLPKDVTFATEESLGGLTRDIREAAVAALETYGFKREVILGVLDQMDPESLGGEVTPQAVVMEFIRANQES